MRRRLIGRVAMYRVCHLTWIAALACHPPLLAQERPDGTRLGGGSDDDALTLTRVGDLMVDDHGILIIDQGARPRILDVSPHGDLRSEWGREGRGPGEFARPGKIGVLGDSVWIVDASLRRVTYFDRSGRVFGTDTRTSPELGGGLEAGVPHTLLPGGGFVAVPGANLTQGPGLVRPDELPLLLVPPEGEPVDTLAIRSMSLMFWHVPLTRQENPPMFHTPSPFRPGRFHHASRNGEHVAWTSEHGGHFTVRWLEATTGARTSFSVPFTPRQVDDTLIDALVTARVEQLVADLPPALAGIRPGAVAALAREALETPPYLPPVTDILVTSDGRAVWVRREISLDGEVTWEKYRRDGTRERWFRASEDLKLFQASADDVLWGVKPDEFDVPVLLELRLGSAR